MTHICKTPGCGESDPSKFRTDKRRDALKKKYQKYKKE
jgi:hypothetical protein